jgi:hypothetical protein
MDGGGGRAVRGRLLLGLELEPEAVLPVLRHQRRRHQASRLSVYSERRRHQRPNTLALACS